MGLELREKNHLTQAELAERLKLSDKTVSKWRQGKGILRETRRPDLSK